MAKMPNTKTKNVQTFSKPVNDEIIVCMSTLIAVSLLIDFKGLSTRAVRRAFKKPGSNAGTKLSKLMITMAKSNLFHGSLK